MQVTWEPGDCFYKPCSRQHAQATSNQAKSQGFEPNNSQAVHRQRTSPGTLGQVFIQTCYAASSSLIQSRKCSINSSWKSIITAWEVWRQRNAQILRVSPLIHRRYVYQYIKKKKGVTHTQNTVELKLVRLIKL